MQTREVMTSDPITVSSSSTLQEALDLLVRNDIHALPVVDDDRLVGIVTDRDLKMMLGPGARTLVESELDDAQLHLEVAEAMTAEVVTVTPDTPLSRVARKLASMRVGNLPVVQGDSLLGIVSITDVLYAAADVFEGDE